VEQLLFKAQELLSQGKDLWIKEGKLSWSTQFKEAALYVMDGGKGTRPALLLWSALQSAHKDTAGTLNQKIETQCREAALAIEMLHVYSLIHDDLPCMDNDDFRRGKPTLHKKYSEAFAVLSGDALLTGAFELLTHVATSDHERVLLIRELSRAAGAAGMIAGQLWDLEAERDQSLDLDLWTKIHDAKTGALFGAAVSMGFVIGSDNISEVDVEEVRHWGVRLGRLFQMVDDRLDKGPFYKKLGEEGLMSLCKKEAVLLDKKAQELWGESAELKSILDFFVNRTA
jgi:geranylgeranyl diphosphate synthase type II